MKKKAIRWSEKSSAAVNARTQLPALAKDFFEAGDALAAAGAGPAAAHRFRIAAKQFRYTLELFRPCYDSGLENWLEELRSIQRLLGDLNDFVTMGRLAEGDAMKAALDLRIQAKIREFHDLWLQRFQAAARGEWLRYLAGRRIARKPAIVVG